MSEPCQQISNSYLGSVVWILFLSPDLGDVIFAPHSSTYTSDPMLRPGCSFKKPASSTGRDEQLVLN